MRIRIFALGLVWAASLYGQHRRFSWQEACFKNPGLPYCPGHDFAIKHPAPAKSADPRSVVSNPGLWTPEQATPSVIVAGGIDWRFADPLADALAGFNVGALSASPLARRLIGQLGAKQGLSGPDMQKVFDRLSSADQVALSVHDNRIVLMVAGRVTTPSALEAGWKAVPVSGNTMLTGHADAVDQAVQRIAANGPPPELTRLAERQASSDFWASGAAELIGPHAVNAGVKRFSLTVSIRNRLTSDVAFEFDGVPSEKALQMWPTALGAGTIEGNVVHARMSMEADEAQQKLSQIAESLLGERLAALVTAVRYLPVRDLSVERQTKPVIYGLDSGPRVVNQDPNR